MSRAVLLVPILLLAGCAREPQPPRDTSPASGTAAPAAVSRPAPAAQNALPAQPSSNAATHYPPVSPPAPGQPGGLPDDRTPISEAPFTPTSAQGAANVVQIYYALLAEHRYEDAWKLWTQGGQDGQRNGMSAEAFTASFGQYESYNANIGAPGPIEGAAGSLFVSVPVVIFGRRKNGEEVHEIGEATLRRVNDVPGSTEEQRQWHLFRIDTKPSPGPAAR